MASVKENWIKKYSPEEFEKKWTEYIKNIAFSRTLEGYVKKHGEEEGRKKYELKNSHLSVGIKTLKAKGLTDQQIKDIKQKHSKNSAINLEHFIKKYGIEQGTKKYNTWIEKSRERSHWCVEYYVSRGFEITYTKEKIKKLQKKDLEYFLLKYGEEEGKNRYAAANKGKSTSLDTYIQKYGEVKGTERFFKNKSKKYSIVEINFIQNVVDIVGKTDDMFYGENQYKFGLLKEKWEYYGQKIFYVDFLDRKNKKVIEFNGDIYHANPNKFSQNDTPNPFNKSLTSLQIWEKDKKRNDFLKELGYEVITVWESDYKNNKNKIIEETVKFLRS